MTTKEQAKKFCLSFKNCSECWYHNTNPKGCVIPKVLFENDYEEIHEAALIIAQTFIRGYWLPDGNNPPECNHSETFIMGKETELNEPPKGDDSDALQDKT